MRLLILGVSAVALSACSMGGMGFGTSDYAAYESGQASNHQLGHYQSGYHQPAPQYGYSEGYAAQSYSGGHAGSMMQPPSYTPSGYTMASPCAQPASPCAATQPQTVNSVQYGQTGYASGYPAMQTPTYGHQGYSSDYSGYASYGCQTNSCYGGGSYGDYGGYGYSVGGHSKNKFGLRTKDYYYGTLGAVAYDVDEPAIGLQGRLGYQSAYLFATEIEGSLGVVADKGTTTIPNGAGGTVTVDTRSGVDNSIAGFGLIRLPFNSNVSAHGRVGYHRTETYAETGQATGNATVRTEETLDGLAYGGGLEVALSAKDAIRADFTRYEGDTRDNDTVSLAYLRRF